MHYSSILFTDYQLEPQLSINTFPFKTFFSLTQIVPIAFFFISIALFALEPNTSILIFNVPKGSIAAVEY